MFSRACWRFLGYILGCPWKIMEVSNWLVSWVITYLRDLQPTFIGVIIHLLSTMDIPVHSRLQYFFRPSISRKRSRNPLSKSTSGRRCIGGQIIFWRLAEFSSFTLSPSHFESPIRNHDQGLQKILKIEISPKSLEQRLIGSFGKGTSSL